MTGTPTDTAIDDRPLALPSPNQELVRMSDAHAADGAPVEVESLNPKGLTFLQALEMCDGGEVAKSINKRWNAILAHLISLDGNEGMRKSKAALTIKATIEYEDGTARLKIESASKVPDAPKRASVFWVTGDGRLTPENPKQLRMFGDVPRRPTIVV